MNSAAVSEPLVSTSHVAESIVLAASVGNAPYEPPADYRLPALATVTINAHSLSDVQTIATVVQLAPITDSATPEGSKEK
jgi:hypothetical protein